MPKWRAKTNGVIPGIKVGDIITTQDDLIPEYKPHFDAYNEGESEVDEDETVQQTAGDNANPVKTGIINPDRNELKAKATQLGINFAPNIPTDRLSELIQDAENHRQDGDGDTDTDKSDEDKSEDEE